MLKIEIRDEEKGRSYSDTERQEGERVSRGCTRLRRVYLRFNTNIQPFKSV